LLQDGDWNTSFFHKQAESRKQFKIVTKIQAQGQPTLDFDKIKEEAIQHFNSIYTEENQDHSLDPRDLLAQAPRKVHRANNQQLTKNISLKEVKTALDNMEDDKAPAPDRFTTRFLKVCWDIIKNYLHKMVLKSQCCNKIGGSTISPFLSLLLKEKVASIFERFRLIPLCNIGYIVITKIMENRLKGILPKLIPENKGGFIKGRKIWDNIILV
jgi:hypothetical protein